MKTSKSGNRLAARLPSPEVKADAFMRLRNLRRPLPAGFVFDREETNERRTYLAERIQMSQLQPLSRLQP